MQVLEREHDRLSAGACERPRRDRRELAAAQLLRREFSRAAGRQRRVDHRREQRRIFGSVESHGRERRLKPGEALFPGDFGAAEAGATPFRDRIKRGVLQELRRGPFDPGVGRLREPGAELLDQPRFAQAGLADDQRKLPLAAARAFPAARENVEFLAAADQRRRRARAAAPAAAAGAHDAVELRPFGDAFQLMLALVLGDEQARDLPVHGARDPYFSGRGGALHARGDVGRFAIDLACGVDHDPTAVEPDAGGEFGRAGRGVTRVEVGERSLDRERRAHRALAVVLLRLGIAEQCHQAVAELLQHVAAERSHGGRGGVEVTPHQISPVLGVEPRRQRSRADQVAKHDVIGRRSASRPGGGGGGVG